MLARLSQEPLRVEEALAHVHSPAAGGIDIFLGVVRDHSEGRAVTRLEYSAYDAMAAREMAGIATELEAELPGVRVAAIHRLGDLGVGDLAIVCAASAPHRDEAFRACRLLIDRIKSRVPIWKREHGPDGTAWVGWVDARCEPGHDHGAHAHTHGDDHGHGHHRP